MKRLCEICGQEFTTYPSRIKIGHGKTCSRKCQAKWQSIHRQGQNSKPKIALICEACGSEFLVIPSRTDARFCSRECKYIGHSKDISGKNHWAWKGKKAKCQNCGQEFHVKPYILKRDEGKFCSMACYNAAKPIRFSGNNNPRWRGGISLPYRGSNWQRQRRQARRRDGYTCQLCGISEDDLGRQLDVHHIKPFSTFHDYISANKLENLICLCHECHGKVELDPLFTLQPEQAELAL